MREKGFFRWRALSPDQEDAVRRAHDRGADSAGLADTYGVHLRTIYRVLARRPIARHYVEFAGYRAAFEVFEDGPLQVTPWLPS